MRLILVDTPAKKIREIEVVELSLGRIYALLGCDTIACHKLFGAKPHVFYCDDEGALKEPPPPSLILEGYEYPIFGRLLIFRATGDGNEASCTLSVPEVFSLVFFLP